MRVSVSTLLVSNLVFVSGIASDFAVVPARGSFDEGVPGCVDAAAGMAAAAGYCQRRRPLHAHCAERTKRPPLSSPLPCPLLRHAHSDPLVPHLHTVGHRRLKLLLGPVVERPRK